MKIRLSAAPCSVMAESSFSGSAQTLSQPDVGRLRDFLYVPFRELCRRLESRKHDAGSRRVGTRGKAAQPAEPSDPGTAGGLQLNLHRLVQELPGWFSTWGS
jgi:hypothetical protein